MTGSIRQPVFLRTVLPTRWREEGDQGRKERGKIYLINKGVTHTRYNGSHRPAEIDRTISREVTGKEGGEGSP